MMETRKRHAKLMVERGITDHPYIEEFGLDVIKAEIESDRMKEDKKKTIAMKRAGKR